MTLETFKSGEVNRDNWAISLTPYSGDDSSPSKTCIEVLFDEATIASLSPGMLARLDQDIAATLDSSTEI